MSMHQKIVPAAVFGLALVATMALRKSPVMASSSPADHAKALPQAGHTKAQRDESSFATVRALLRDGRIDEARVLLRQLAASDPVAFFKLLAKLPGLPGVDDIVREAAGGLPWNDQAIIDMLNGIKSKDLRDLAWGAYITPRAGVLPDEEVYAVGVKANETRFMSAMGGLFKDAAEKRPDSFFAFLNTTKSTFLRVAFFEELMKFHPERASDFFRSIPDGAVGGAYDKSYILQTRIKALPTAENLKAVLLERGERGVYEGSSGSFLVSSAYPNASPGEKAKMLDFIASQPPVARNRLLGGIAFSTMFKYNDPIAPAEFSKILETYTSGHLQERALGRWMERNKDLVAKDPGWIETLPSERLKNYVRKTNEKPESAPKP